MSDRVTATAPSNIAFIKYWGTRDVERTLPYNPSISMTLSRCVSRCTVERRPAAEGIVVLWRPEGEPMAPAPEAFRAGVAAQLERLAAAAGADCGFRVATENSFPTGAGIASSASGFAALTVAAAAALELELTPEELSAWARRSGSGSAARSVLGGYVEWPAVSGDDSSPAAALWPASHWRLSDLVAVVDARPKGISSRDGHRAAPGSPYFARRQELLPERLERVRRAIAARSMAELGPVVEEEALDLHLIAMSSRPPIHYWRPGTLAVLEAARRLRGEGVEVWATIDAGPNVHLICETADEERVAKRVRALPEVERLIVDRVGEGPRLLEEHLA